MEHWVVQIGNMTFNMDTLLTMWSAMLFLIIFAFISTRKLSIIPNKLQAFCETIMNFFYGVLDMMMPENNRKHVPLIASLFLFILMANLMGQLPLKLIELKHGEFASPTNDINLTGALAIIVLVYYVFMGLKKKKFKFFLPSFSVNGIIMGLVELLEMITRPMSLAIRLFANIFAGEILVTVLMSVCAYFLPLPIMLFELLVAFIQATVFMMLTIAYISSATSDEH